MATATNCPDAAGLDLAEAIAQRLSEKIIVLRYNEKKSRSWADTARMALTAALSNAHQAPYTSWQIFEQAGLVGLRPDVIGGNDEKAPNLEDLLRAVAALCHFPPERVSPQGDRSIPCVELSLSSTIFRRTSQDALSLFRFFNGDPDEVDGFDELNPPFFFVNTYLTKRDITGTVLREPLFVPVWQKDGVFYLCEGQSTSKVYEIENPHWLFFSAAGHELLLLLITAPYMINNGYTRVVFDQFENFRHKRVLTVPNLPQGQVPGIDWSRLR